MTESVSVQPSRAPLARTLMGLLIVAGLSALAWWITVTVNTVKLPFGVPGKIFEYPLWGALAGVAGNIILRMLHVRDAIQSGIRTELFLKTGLVLLGAGINLSLIATAASGALVQSILLITSVFGFCWWLSGKFGLDDRLRAVMSTAISICGVSAAIAAAGAVLARKEQVTFVTAIVILVALPLMVIAPLLAGMMNLTEAVAGAWFGGNIDTTAAVVGAGTMYGEHAQKMAAIVKSTQNVMIGVVVFLLTVYFTVAEQRRNSGRAGVAIFWQRFPKFIVGFLAASVLYTLGLIDGGKGTPLEAIKNWFFLFAFVGMGLELSTREFKTMGAKPVWVFLIVTVFNTVIALVVAWAIFTYLFPVPA